MQHEEPVIWLLVDTDKQETKLSVITLFTGEEIKFDIDTYSYLGSYQTLGLVYHVFAKQITDNKERG